MTGIYLGKGLLSWDGSERRSDRYGSFGLFNEDCEDVVVTTECEYAAKNIESLDNQLGQIVVEVIEPRKSKHIGDFFRGFFPTMPDKGETLVLGEGKFFFTKENYGFRLGLKPLDGRQTDWLNPEKLFRCHESLVKISFMKLPN